MQIKFDNVTELFFPYVKAESDCNYIDINHRLPSDKRYHKTRHYIPNHPTITLEDIAFEEQRKIADIILYQRVACDSVGTLLNLVAIGDKHAEYETLRHDLKSGDNLALAVANMYRQIYEDQSLTLAKLLTEGNDAKLLVACPPDLGRQLICTRWVGNGDNGTSGTDKVFFDTSTVAVTQDKRLNNQVIVAIGLKEPFKDGKPLPGNFGYLGMVENNIANNKLQVQYKHIVQQTIIGVINITV